MKIDGATIVVTGGASGLGLEFASHLVAIGARVWAIDNDLSSLDRAKAEHSTEKSIRFVACDVSQSAEVEKVVGEISAECEGIDVLINNAAVLRDQTLVSKLGGKIKKHSIDDWQATLESNLTGCFLMAREVVAGMIDRKQHGLIVNISSISRAGNPGQSAYSATKAGIDALTVTWSQELAPYHIRVVAIAPGFAETGMTENIPSMFVDGIKQQTPLKRFGRLDEFGHAIQFVIENDYLNGKVLELDGGLRF